MTTVVFEIPDDVAEQAGALGLLTSEKIAELLSTEVERLASVRPMSRADFVQWLDSTPLAESWGNLEDTLDSGEHAHDLRRRSAAPSDKNT